MASPDRLTEGFDGWRTPLDLAQEVRGVFGGSIGLDPCTEPGNHLRAEEFCVPPGTPIIPGSRFTIDGLEQPWQDRTWVNPPYSKLRLWLPKVMHEAHLGHRIGLLLSVSRTEMDYMQSVVRAASCIQLLVGKLKFSEGSRTGQLASWILWFNVAPEVVSREMGWRGAIVTTF